MPEPVEPRGAVLRLADDDHLLLFKLVDAVYAALLDAVRADLLAEARRIARERLRKLLLLEERVDELADHRVLARADQVQILALDLVHHVLHLGEAHDAVHHAAANHIRRNAIGEAAVDHEIARVRQDGRVQPRDVAHEIIEAVAAGLSGAVEIDAREFFHDFHMVRHRKIRHNRLAEALALDVLGIVPTDRNGRIDDVRDHEHALADLGLVFRFLRLERGHFIGHALDLLLCFLGLVALTARHHAADLLGDDVALISKLVAARLCGAERRIQLDHLIDEDELFVLKFLFDVLAHHIRVRADQFDIDHRLTLPSF